MIRARIHLAHIRHTHDVKENFYNLKYTMKTIWNYQLFSISYGAKKDIKWVK